MITTAIGLASMFIEAIPILVVGGLEALSGVFLLGGGIVCPLACLPEWLVLVIVFPD